MADLEITYKGSKIVELSESGNKTLKTSGKYCEGDISVAYTKPSGGDDKWERPSNYPQYTDEMMSDFEGVYFTYDASIGSKQIHINCVTDSGNWVLQKGTISNGIFTSTAEYVQKSNVHYQEQLVGNEGIFCLRVFPQTGHITEIGMGNNYSDPDPYQGVLERYARLPYITILARYNHGGQQSWREFFEKSCTLFDLNCNLNYGFRECFGIENLRLVRCKTTSGMYEFMSSCVALKYINFEDCDLKPTTIGAANRSFFQNLYSIKKLNVGLIDLSNLTGTADYTFVGMVIDSLKPPFDFSQLTSLNCLCGQYNSGLICKKLDLSDQDFSNIVNMNTMFRNCIISELIFPENCIVGEGCTVDINTFAGKIPNIKNFPKLKVSFSISSTGANHDSIVSIFNSLPEVSDGQTITLGSTLLGRVNDTEKAIATGKGWTLA